MRAQERYQLDGYGWYLSSRVSPNPGWGPSAAEVFTTSAVMAGGQRDRLG